MKTMAKIARSRPSQAMLAGAAAVLACAVIGVLLAAYLNEVRAEGPRPARPQPASTASSSSTAVSTIVVPEPGDQTVIRPPRVQRPTRAPLPPPPRTVTVTAPPPAPTTDCTGLLGCLLGGQ